jgi:hypothetical protein
MNELIQVITLSLRLLFGGDGAYPPRLEVSIDPATKQCFAEFYKADYLRVTIIDGSGSQVTSLGGSSNGLASAAQAYQPKAPTLQRKVKALLSIRIACA